MSKKTNSLWRAVAIGVLVLLLSLTAHFMVSRMKAWQVWARHEKVIAGLVNKQSTNGEEFQDAIYFFSDITGIMARVDTQYVGIVPTVHMADDLKLWRDWYRSNRYRLYWNFLTKEVNVKD